MEQQLPKTQRAVQLVGPNELILNEAAPVPRPGPHQILCRVEAVGLCFSDLKLLKQFAEHPRKSAPTGGIDSAALAEIPSYVPGTKPTVPGHEAVVRVVAVGTGISRWQVGERYLVQADYRWLPTLGANAAFGYNFEGGLQEYVLFDERVVVAPDGESSLLPAREDFSASSIALVEPWACVEEAYAERPRRTVKADGKLLVVADTTRPESALDRLLEEHGQPTTITWARVAELGDLPDTSFDDVIYFGANAETVERLFPKLAPRGLMNLTLCSGRFARPVTTPVGRAHYHALRLVGTMGNDPADSMADIPESTEIRDGDCVNVVGAGGPMGVMHVLRTLSLGRPGVRVYAADLDEARLENLRALAADLVAKTGAYFRAYNPTQDSVSEVFTYLAIMAPVPKLVAQALQTAGKRAIINVFAGIPVGVSADLDLNAYLEKQLFLAGTSGSTVEDMRAVLARLERGELNTDLSVAAVSGLEGAIEGIRAVEENRLPGKIIVYPSCRGLDLTPLPPGERWNAERERALLEARG